MPATFSALSKYFCLDFCTGQVPRGTALQATQRLAHTDADNNTFGWVGDFIQGVVACFFRCGLGMSIATEPQSIVLRLNLHLGRWHTLHMRLWNEALLAAKEPSAAAQVCSRR